MPRQGSNHQVAAAYTSTSANFADSATDHPLTFTVGPATPTVTVSAPGGTYDGKAFPATAQVSGTDGQAGDALEGVMPAVTYYAGGSALPGAPTAAGTYTAVAAFPGSADYAAASSDPVTFTVSPAAHSTPVAATRSGRSCCAPDG